MQVTIELKQERLVGFFLFTGEEMRGSGMGSASQLQAESRLGSRHVFPATATGLS
jgi:hypothetical protein